MSFEIIEEVCAASAAPRRRVMTGTQVTSLVIVAWDSSSSGLVTPNRLVRKLCLSWTL